MAKTEKAAPAKKAAVTPKGAKTKAKLNRKALDKKTEAAEVVKAVKNRELKYIYPKAIQGEGKILERKAFRQKIRAAIKSFEKRIEGFEGTAKAKKALVKEFNTYQATVLA